MAESDPQTESPVVVSSDTPETTTPPTPYEENAAPEPVDEGNDVLVDWKAAEFIHHEKSAGWYYRLAGVAIVIAIGVFLLTKDKISTGVVIFGALLFGIYARRQPRELEYALATHGLTIGGKYHSYEEFRSFSIVPETSVSSAVFRPLKRFGQILTIYFPHELEEQIEDILADRLPYEDHHNDPIDNLMRRIRF